MRKARNVKLEILLSNNIGNIHETEVDSIVAEIETILHTNGFKKEGSHEYRITQHWIDEA